MDREFQANIRLFSYGTLQLPKVQTANYGRLLEGRPDVLVGWRLAPLNITDSRVIQVSGLEVHNIACRTGSADDRIPGTVFSITAEELDATDRYEVDAYGRVEVELESGIRAFVYVGYDGGSVSPP